MTLTRIESDHNPILVDDGAEDVKVKRGFIFESAWLSNADFKNKLIERWSVREGEEIQDFWKKLKKEIRQLSKGMGANLDGEMRT
jgi:hypothetical protein